MTFGIKLILIQENILLILVKILFDMGFWNGLCSPRAGNKTCLNEGADMQGFAKKARFLGLAIAAGMFGTPVQAGELLPLAEIPTVTGELQNFCAPYGDFIACSTAVLNFVTNGGVNQFGIIVDKNAQQQNGAFKIGAAQGDLSKDDIITVYGGSNAVADNPTIGADDPNTDPQENLVMDDAYTSSASQANVTGFSTNKTPSAAELAAGVQVEADPNSEGPPANQEVGNADDDFAGDTNDYWDIQLGALIKGLTLTGQGAGGTDLLRDPVFVFDNNQVGEDTDASIKLWGVIALRDIDGLDGLGNQLQNPLANLVFEFRGCNDNGFPTGDPGGCAPNSPKVLDPSNNETVVDPTLFTSNNALGDDPLVDEYALVQGEYCVDANFAEVACDGNQEVEFDQNLGTGNAEFFGFLPELTGARLKQLLAMGYDVISMDLRFFDQSNGFEDLFIMAMRPESIPEPGSLALLGLGGLGFAAFQRRRRRA